MDDSIFETWSLYQKVITRNYMQHADIPVVLAAAVGEHFGSDAAALGLLDLGCGDAEIARQLIRQLPFATFHGVDLSASALEHANAAFQNAEGIDVRLTCAPLLDFLLEAGPVFDVLMAGYSLHHYQEIEKRDFFSAAKSRTAQHGCLFVYDVFCEENESRSGYLDRYMHWVNGAWRDMTARELKLIEAHIRSSDFPASSQGLMIYGMESGFDEVIELWRDSSGFHRLLMFR